MPGLPVPFAASYRQTRPYQLGGGQVSHYVGAPLLHADYELTVSGVLELVRPVSIRTPAYADFSYGEVIQAAFAGSMVLGKDVELRLAGVREPAHRYTAILREDEELLLF